MGAGPVGFRGLIARRAGVPTAAAVAAVIVVPASAVAMGGDAPKASSDAAVVSVRVGVGLGFAATLLILLIGVIADVGVSKLFVGDDNRISTSKTVPVVWSMIVAGALFGFVYANLFNHPQALSHTGGNVGQYAVLFGGPLGAAILAKQIVTTQVANKKTTRTKGKPSAKDLVSNDTGEADLGDFQYVLFNLLAMFFVISTLFHSPLSGLPHIPDVLLGLTSVSAVGYVGKKALTPSATLTAKLDSNTVGGPAGTNITVEVRGLDSSRQNLHTLVRFGTADNGTAVSSAVTAGEADLHVTSPPNTGASADVDVSVVTDDGAVLDAGKYTYQ
jgi:hypothetical protein